MLVTRDELAKVYQQVYPDLEDHYCIITSEVFLVPSFPMLLEWVKKYSVAHIPHVSNIADCEKRAWFFINSIHRERAEEALQLPKEERYTMSIGWLTGIRRSAFGETPHTIVTAYTDKGIKNLEPKTDTIQKVDISKFNALLLVI